MERLLQMGGMGGMGQVSFTMCCVKLHSSEISSLSLSLSLSLLPSQPPPGVDTPLMDTAETVYISSLALLKVDTLQFSPAPVIPPVISSVCRC